MSHPDLDADAQTRLTATFGRVEASSAPDDPSHGSEIALAATPEPAIPLGARAKLRRRVRTSLSPVAEPALERLTELVSGRLRQRIRSENDELAASVEVMRAQLGALQDAVAGSNMFTTGGAAHRMGELEVNAELMKSELAAFRTSLEDLGQAIAPAAGLPGVPARFNELREQVNALDRQLRASGRSALSAAPTTDGAPPVAALPAPTSSGFDYVGFERRFRGDSDVVLQTLSERYAPMLADHQPVLDFGCGRGELVEVLTAQGIEATGVDSDPGMIEEALGHGRSVHLGDGLEYLRFVAPHSLGSVISIHVAEHLPLPVLVELFELAARALRPGGIFIAETPNPMSLIVLGNSYILDPTHVWPLHPSLMTFLAERAGFRGIDLAFYSPAESYRLTPIGDSDHAPAWISEVNVALERLNDVLFGPQEYALIARTPPADAHVPA